MVITTTAIGFIVLSLGLGICGFFFLRAFKRTRTDSKISFLVSSILLSFSIQNSLMGIGALFFPLSPKTLIYSIAISNVLLTFIALMGVYISYYIFSPNISPKFSMSATGVVGLIAAILAITMPAQPFITQTGGIDFNMNFLLSMATFCILFISIGSTVYIFGKLFFTTENFIIKRLSATLALFGIWGIVNAFIRFLLFYRTSVTFRTLIFDIGLGLIGISFIIFLVIAPLFEKVMSRKFLLK